MTSILAVEKSEAALAATPDAARAFLYAYLSRCFAFPDAGFAELGPAGDDLIAAAASAGLDPAFAIDAAAVVAAISTVDLAVEHTRVFTTGFAAPAAETAYELDKAARRAAELADINGFYRAFGFALASPVEADGLVAELEFLSNLLHKRLHAEAAGNGEGVAICGAAYRAFLTDHLGRWVETFVTRLDETGSSFYRTVGRLLAALIASEVAREGGTPTRVGEYRLEAEGGSTWPCQVGPAPA
jgi:TorA maturation chaperone TorD